MGFFPRGCIGFEEETAAGREVTIRALEGADGMTVGVNVFVAEGEPVSPALQRVGGGQGREEGHEVSGMPWGGDSSRVKGMGGESEGTKGISDIIKDSESGGLILD